MLDKTEAKKILNAAMQDISSTRTVLADYRDRPGLPDRAHEVFENELGKLGGALVGLTVLADMIRTSA